MDYSSRPMTIEEWEAIRSALRCYIGPWEDSSEDPRAILIAKDLESEISTNIERYKDQETPPDLIVDTHRILIPELRHATGIFVRAKLKGHLGTYDLAVLTKESLKQYLDDLDGNRIGTPRDSVRSRENIIGIALGHGHLHDNDEHKEKEVP